MKQIKMMLGVALMSMLSVTANAAGAMDNSNYVLEDDVEYINTNIDENGNRIHGAYLTNPWYSNWIISLSGGVQTLVSGTKEYNEGIDFNTARLTPSYEFYIAKWLTPVLAVRFGAQGLSLEENFDKHWNGNHYIINNVDGVNYYNETYFHGDVMWNFVNTIWGYKANRFYNIVPYAHAGYLRLSDPDEPLFTKNKRDRELNFGFGLYNTFRLTNKFQFIVDLRWGNIAGRFHDVSNGGRVNLFTANAGVAYNIEKWYWSRSRGLENARDAAIADAAASVADAANAKADADAARKALDDVMKQNQALKNQVKDAQDELSSYVKLTPDEFQRRVAEAGLVVYYQINISKLNFSEKHHLDDYIKATLATDPKHVFYLTGSADEGTGNFETNTRLSKERAEGVKEVLIKEYNVPEDQVVIKATIISSEHEDGSLDRCVLLENK